MAHELYTSCTACGAVFEITLEQLSLANGAVRCGVCGATFNARESLREGPADLDTDEQAEPVDQELSDAAAEAERVLAQSESSPPLVDDVVDADGADADAWEVTEQLVAPELTEAGATPDDEGPSQEQEDDTRDGTDFDGLLSDTSGRRPGLLSALGWSTLGLLMLLLAAAQVTVYWRDHCIQIAWLNGPLLALNERLGEPLDFTYDVSRYRFVDRPRLLVDASAPAPGPAQVLQVQAELANEARVPQPLPHLRLILEDRWGRPVASRTLSPDEYLPPGRSAQQYLQPEERVIADARVATEEAAPQAYTLDICLRTADGQLDCGDSPTNR